MLTWKDANGRTWSTRITLADARRLKDNGTDLLDTERMKDLFGDTLTIVEVMAELARTQWIEKELTYPQFADLVIETPEVYEKASAAFVEGITDFFRRLARPALAELVEKAFEAAQVTQQTMMARVQGSQINRLILAAQAKAEKEFDDAIENEIAKLQPITGE